MTPQQTSTYKAALKEARAAFDTATNRLDQITRESASLRSDIFRLRKTITALAALCSESPGFDTFGITEACIEAMEVILHTASTTDVVSNLESMGFDIASQKNAAASVHTVLSRLADKGKIKKIDNGEEVVGWRGPNYDAEIDQIMQSGDVPF